MATETDFKLEIFAQIPFFFHVFGDRADREALARDAIHDLVELEGIAQLRLWNDQTFPIKFEVIEDLAGFPELAQAVASSWVRAKLPHWYLVCSTRVHMEEREFAETRAQNSGREMSDNDIIELFKFAASSELHKTVLDLFLASCISSPGAFDIAECWRSVDGKGFHEEHGALTTFDEARQRSITLGWPQMRVLPVREVYQWLQQVPGFRERKGRGRVGRAVAAVNHLLKERSKDQDELSLVWALLGLEALYGHGNTGLKSQILEKSEAYLGERKSGTKKFGWMYDFRSRLLHGDLDMPFSNYESGIEVEKHYSEIAECEELATATLLSTLQKLCATKSYDLEFRYVLEKQGGVRE